MSTCCERLSSAANVDGGWSALTRSQRIARTNTSITTAACRSLEGGPEQRCTAKRVRRDELDAVVWDAITTWIQSPRMLLQEVEAWRTSRAGAEQAARDRTRLEGAEQRLREQVDRLVDAYQRGALSVEELKARRERLEASRDAARARIEELAGEEMDRDRLDRLGDDIEAFADTLRAGLGKLDFQNRQRLVRLLVEKVRCHRRPHCDRARHPALGSILRGCVNSVDVLECSQCHGRLRVLAAITEPDVAREILARLGQATTAPRPARARDPTWEDGAQTEVPSAE